MKFRINTYTIKYYWRKFWAVFGLCSKCWCKVNYTVYGAPICPQCGKRL